MAAMLEVQHKGICYKYHCQVQPAWVADIVCHNPRDWLQAKNFAIWPASKFDNDFEIESKYHRKIIVLLL